MTTSLYELFCALVNSRLDAGGTIGQKGLKWLWEWWADSEKETVGETALICDKKVPTLNALRGMQMALTIPRYSTIGLGGIFCDDEGLYYWHTQCLSIVKEIFWRINSLQKMYTEELESALGAGWIIEYNMGQDMNRLVIQALIAGSSQDSSEDIFTDLRRATETLSRELSVNTSIQGFPGDAILDDDFFGTTRAIMKYLVQKSDAELVKDMLAMAAKAHWYEIIQSILDLGVSISRLETAHVCEPGCPNLQQSQRAGSGHSSSTSVSQSRKSSQWAFLLALANVPTTTPQTQRES